MQEDGHDHDRLTLHMNLISISQKNFYSQAGILAFLSHA